MPDRSKDRAIDGLARRQYGAFHRRQAVRIGFTRGERRSRLGNGRWIRLLDSEVYALPSHPGTWLRQCSAATLSVPAAAVSGPAAAALHAFEGWKRSHIEVCTHHGTTHSSPFATVRETRTVGRLTVVEGIRVVSPADCIVQLAGIVDAGTLGATLDDAARPRRSLLPELRDRYVALARSRLPGIAGLRQILDARGEGYAPPASELERRFRTFLASVTLPAVEFEMTPPWLAAGEQRVDALISPWRLIVEADGRDWHTRVADFERDRERDAIALSHGHATLRLTWHQLVHRSVWCRNVLVAIGAQRSGAVGRATTTPAESNPLLFPAGHLSGANGCATTNSAGSMDAAAAGRSGPTGGATAA